MMSACPSGRDQRQSGLTAHEMPALGFFLLCLGGVSVPGSNDEKGQTLFIYEVKDYGSKT